MLKQGWLQHQFDLATTEIHKWPKWMKREAGLDQQEKVQLMLSYIACPYSHVDNKIREERFRVVNLVAGYLFRNGVMFFSPISHAHPINKECNIGGDWKTWKKLDFLHLRVSTEVIVVPIEGWKESVGVTEELELAKALDIPVRFFELSKLDINYSYPYIR